MKAKLVKISKYVRKGKYVEYRMTAPPGNLAVLLKLEGTLLRRSLGNGFRDAYLLIVDPSDGLVGAIQSLNAKADAVVLFRIKEQPT